jgi:tetratricopeptide (TPR) repeat protein
MRKISNKHHEFLIYLLLALVTLIAFESVRQNQFVDYDDQRYVTENPNVNAGITRDSFIWAFTTICASNWHPLTWLSHMLDCQLFELNPSWHHLMNLLFHVANTLLLFWVLKRMTGDIWPSAFVAALFAIHPLHVESVVWVAERKDVLSGLFWFLTIAVYIRYAENPKISTYLLVFLCISLGLMAKPMLVTLPFVLLLLDWWPLSRVQWENRFVSELAKSPHSVTPRFHRASIWRLMGEKIPLFAMATASSVITYIAQQRSGAMTLVQKLPFSIRVENALVSYLNYIIKMFYPARLAVLYPHPRDGLPVWQPTICFIILAIVSASVIYLARRHGYLAVGWLLFLGTLVPVIGLVQVGHQAMADRYTYLPSIGIFVMIAWTAAKLSAGWRYRKVVLGMTAAVVLVVLLVCTRKQVRYWQNSLTLFGRAVEVTENNHVMHCEYGTALQRNNQPDEALEQYRKCLRIAPHYSTAQNNLGVIYFQNGRMEQALACWTDLLKFKPDHVGAMNNLGTAYFQKGNVEQALACWTNVLELESDNLNAINSLAWVRATQENRKFCHPDEAVRLAERACDLSDFKNPVLLDTLAAAYAASGRFSDAVATAEQALELVRSSDKKLAEAIQNRLHLYKTGRPYIQP